MLARLWPVLSVNSGVSFSARFHFWKYWNLTASKNSIGDG